MRTKTEAPTLRKFGLLDAMILVVAAALSLFWLRAWSKQGVGIGYFFGPGPSPLFHRIATARAWFNGVVPILAPLTFASIVFGIRRPRPSPRRIASQPGPVACLAASAIFALHFAREIAAIPAAWAFRESKSPSGFIDDWEPVTADLASVGAFAGAAIVGAWVTLALGRRWRPEASWVDRSGRLLGIAWIAVALIQLAFEGLWPFGIGGLI